MSVKPTILELFSSTSSCCQKSHASSSSRKLYIGAVAKITGLSIDTIRYYEKQKLIKTPSRTSGGYRLYGPGELGALRFTTKAQQLGFSLKEIRKLLDIQRTPGGECAKTARVIEEKLAQVRGKVKHLSEIEYYLAEALGKCRRTRQETRNSLQNCPVLDELAS